jgi:hypothetical protein
VVIDTADAPRLMRFDDARPDHGLLDQLSLLDQLRGTGEPRPKVDPELAGGLREWLEDSLCGPARRIADGGQVVRIGSRLVAAPPAGPLGRQLLGSTRTTRTARAARTVRAAHDEMLTSLVRCVFREWVTTGIVNRPLEDALEALSIWGDRGGIVEAVGRLDADRRSALADEVAVHASVISDAWPALCPAWYPRTRERICVPLCGGRILLGSVGDLVIGTQASKEATVCLVQVGTTPDEIHSNLPELHFIALLETLRAGAPPCRVARYVTGTGELHVECVDEHMLVDALVKTVEAADLATSVQAQIEVVGAHHQ